MTTPVTHSIVRHCTLWRAQLVVNINLIKCTNSKLKRSSRYVSHIIIQLSYFKLYFSEPTPFDFYVKRLTISSLAAISSFASHQDHHKWSSICFHRTIKPLWSSIDCSESDQSKEAYNVTFPYRNHPTKQQSMIFIDCVMTYARKLSLLQSELHHCRRRLFLCFRLCCYMTVEHKLSTQERLIW